MKTIAFLFALCIAAVGVLGLVSPELLGAIGARFVVPGAFYALATVRIAFGAVLVRVAPASRAPRTLRVVGWAIVVLGVLALPAGALIAGRMDAAGTHGRAPDRAVPAGAGRLHRLGLRAVWCFIAGTLIRGYREAAVAA